MNLRKRSLYIGLVLFIGHPSFAQTIIKPGIKSATRFAVIIDEYTYNNTKASVTAYKEMLETKEGLGTYVVIDNWKNPDDVKTAIGSIQKEAIPLEGIVLVGNIPVAMIRNAQHLTTAFKMDEQKYSADRSSVASDRFYDDMGLTFRYIQQDAKRPLWHYYELAETSRQYIQSDFYSARIMSHKTGTKAYQEISDFLQKAVAARNLPQPLDHLLAFTGGGYNSESLNSWTHEQAALKELFPSTFKNAATAKMLNFRMEPQMKFRLFSEMQRPELDLTILTEHGDIGKQYINNQEGPADSITKANANILTADLKNFKPQSRMVIFNACYNGSFHHPENITGAYIFNPGQTLITQGNTVNVLQDKWAIEQIGLLNYGVRAGLWAYQSHTLESHLIGDPTWHFTSIKNQDLNQRIVLDKNKPAIWKTLLLQPDPALQSLALNLLYQGNAPDIEKILLNTYKSSSYQNVRMQCLALLARIGGLNYTNALTSALQDPYELIRRKAADWSARNGDDKLIAPLVSLAIQSANDERVLYNVYKALAVMNTVKIKEEITRQLNSVHYIYGKEDLLNQWMKTIQKEEDRANATLVTILDKAATNQQRIQSIRLMRNSSYHAFVPQLLKLAEDVSEPTEIRQNLIEMLGWFNTSYQQAAILSTCKKISNNHLNPKEVNNKAIQTILRLEKWRLL